MELRVLKGYISDYVGSLDPLATYKSLPVYKKLLFKLMGLVRVEKVHVITPHGVEGDCDVYLARCPRCKSVYLDYPHYYTKYLECPKCSARIYL